MADNVLAGTVQLIVVAVGAGVVSGQATPPTVTTSLAPVVENPLPLIVSLFPPRAGPLAGVTEIVEPPIAKSKVPAVAPAPPAPQTNDLDTPHCRSLIAHALELHGRAPL